MPLPHDLALAGCNDPKVGCVPDAPRHRRIGAECQHTMDRVPFRLAVVLPDENNKQTMTGKADEQQLDSFGRKF